MDDTRAENDPENGAEAYESNSGQDQPPLSHQHTLVYTSTGSSNIEKTTSTFSVDLHFSLLQEIIFVGTVCSAQFHTQVSLNGTLVILHVIGDSFGITNPGVLSWLIAGYSLTVGTFILVAGRLGDLYGYKRLLLIGFSWFALWSLIAGLSVYSNSVLFIFARVFQGFGPALCLPNGLAILGVSYKPGMRKNMMFALFGACAPVGAVFGYVFGALFALIWWPWVYWSFTIALIGTVITAAIIIPPDSPRAFLQKKNRSWMDLAAQLDLLGGATGVTALVLINFAWNQAGVVGWAEAYVFVLLIIGFLFACAFFYVEMRVSREPLIPFNALHGDVGFVIACIACGWACFGIWIFYTFQFVEVLKGVTPILAAAWFCPLAISGSLAAITTGYLLGRLGPAWVMTAALSCFLTGVILIATAPVDQIYWAQIFVCTLIMPWGMDMSFPAGTLILSNAVDKKHQGIAASLINTVVNYSISLGLGFAGTVQTQVNDGGHTPGEILLGYRGALYMGIGFAGLGLAISLIFVAKSYLVARRQKSG